MSRRGGRTQVCSAADARARLTHASKFLEVAELVAMEEPDNPESANVAASLAVLAGIAASDAACCAALGRRSRGQDHRDAEALLGEVVPGGDVAAKRLRRLLNLKDAAQYGSSTSREPSCAPCFVRPKRWSTSRRVLLR